jgi:polysaccharide biosynthesis protein PelF
MSDINFPQADKADIALILEGSYPYIHGGVASWMHQIIQAFSDIEFAIIFIGSNPKDYTKGLRYELPENVVHMENHYLFPDDMTITRNLSKADFKGLKLFHDFINTKIKPQQREGFADLNFFIDLNPGDNYENFFQSKKNWSYVVDTYNKYCTEPSFIAYFWAIMNLQKPVWEIANIVPNFIKTKAIHTISTGYAGLLGALLNHYNKTPLILTEHGIYTKERRIELLQNQITKQSEQLQRFFGETSYITDLWMRFFDLLSKICYECAEPITSLYGGARNKQILEGANPERAIVIPNGIDIAKFKPCRKLRSDHTPPVLCLIGRVVPIKDIKTFIRAINIAKKQLPNIEGWIAGPVAENPDYFEECKNLVAVLDIEKNIKFMPGMQNILDIFPEIGLTTLSSISEGMPLILLESFASGVPALATNVGACQELIFGVTEEDKKIGSSGAIVNIADPQALANKAVELLTDKQKWDKAQLAAIKRTEIYYTQEQMFAAYQKIYDNFME